MKIRIGFFAVMLVLSLMISRSVLALAALLAALFHELGHLLIARKYKIQFQECKVGLFGAGLYPDNSLFSYKQEIALCAAGPLFNFLLAAALLPVLSRYPHTFLLYLYFSSLSLGILNLLPIRDFDGGRILYSVLSIRCSQHTSSLCLSFLSFLSLFILWSFSVYFLLRASATLSLFIFTVSIFFRIFMIAQ